MGVNALRHCLERVDELESKVSQLSRYIKMRPSDQSSNPPPKAPALLTRRTRSTSAVDYKDLPGATSSTSTPADQTFAPTALSPPLPPSLSSPFSFSAPLPPLLQCMSSLDIYLNYQGSTFDQLDTSED